MKNVVSHFSAVIFGTSLFLMVFSCNNNAGPKTPDKTPVTPAKTFIKPPGTYPDTLMINYPAAVFYYPDSLQLSKIKAVSDSMFYEASMHEYFYQMLTAHTILKRTWPGLTVIESKKYRFLVFINKNDTRHYIDLDTKSDTHGLFVFDGKKPPIMVDMTNIETVVSFYLKE